MVWSNQAVDKITVPASVPIGGAQDGVILSGVDVPAELKAYGLTAVIIFQRGGYPSFGPSIKEAKYYFMGIVSGSTANGRLAVGTVVDEKNGTLTPRIQIYLPSQYYNDARTGLLIGSGSAWQNMDFNLDVGSHQTRAVIAPALPAAHAGQTTTAQGWYNVALNAGWTTPSVAGWPVGVEFKPTATNVMHIRGGVNCPAAGSTVGIICNIGTNDYFKTFPSLNQNWPIIWISGASSGVCQLKLMTNGDLLIDANLTVPPNGATLYFMQSYENYQ